MHPGKILMSLWMRPWVPWWILQKIHGIFQEWQLVAMIGTYDLDGRNKFWIGGSHGVFDRFFVAPL